MPSLPPVIRIEAFRDNPSGHLLDAVMALSRQTDLAGVMTVTRQWARDLTGADGVTFVLADGDMVEYADEDAIGPLWKGQRFPASSCISGWAIQHRQAVVVPDVYADSRIPVDTYRPTFVRSLAIVPIRPQDPLGAIGAYWATNHVATEREVAILQALADATSTALTNVTLIERLRKAIQVRDDFLRVASHEMRTPVTALALQVCNLKRRCGPSLGVQGEDRIAGIEHSVNRLTMLVEQILDTGSALTDDLRPLREATDLLAVIATVLDRLSETIARSGCTLHVEAPQAVRGCWDQGYLHTVVYHLVSNAIKYGAGRPVLIDVSTDADTATITVVDHGIGIAAADQERIFERFARAVAVEHYGGFGLGLWLVRVIVEAQGGTVTVDSEPGAGASFIVQLPLRQATP
jgi:signal transduction histidine kinase